MTSIQKVEANRRNALKSTGPRTSAGKARSRLNAVTHGLTAQTLILPGEDEPAYQQRLAAWIRDLTPCNAFEEDLVVQAVSLSWRLDRVDRVQAALLAERIAVGPIEEESDGGRRSRTSAADCGPASHQPPPSDPLGIRRPTPVSPDDPDDPARLVNRLEATAEGCRWLLDRWAGLREVIDRGLAWPTAEMVGAIRMLGKQPLDAADDRRVLAIILACFAMDRDRPDPFVALWETLTAREVQYYRERLLGRGLGEAMPPTSERARERLLDIVDEAVEPLEVLEARWRSARPPSSRRGPAPCATTTAPRASGSVASRASPPGPSCASSRGSARPGAGA